MSDCELKVTVTEGDRFDTDWGIRNLKFTRVFDAHMSVTNVERVTDDDLRATRDAINDYLGET